MNLYHWFKSFFTKREKEKTLDEVWKELLSGDHVLVSIKSPEKIGIITEIKSTTYQRLDEEDIRTLSLEGYVIRKDMRFSNPPAKLEFLEMSVLKKKNGRVTFVDYLLIKDEIDCITLLPEKK